jgi:D-beta-D-heptose 7-phosphate kinase / D-beta-D-heptose 1-phosphate adenosyltransferase
MKNLLNIIPEFSGKKIIVIGDVILDCYIEGDVVRISAEAPVPVLKANSKTYEPGGAANVAANISSMNGKAILFGFIGDDLAGKKLKKIIEEKGIEFYFGLAGITTRKERPMTGEHQLLRIDYEDITPKFFNDEILKILKQKILESDIIVISDYNKGTITKELMDFIKNNNKKIIIDPKPNNADIYSDVDLMKLNEKEALQISKENNYLSAGKYLKNKYDCDILITRGSEGMALFSENNTEIPTYSKEVFDVTGAGDTVLAALSLGLSSGASLEEAAVLANYAAGIAVERKGTYCTKFEELRKRILNQEEKIVELKELLDIVETMKKENKKIVWTNGCFDLFHIGHKYSIEKAKEKGDILIVGVDSDESVRKLKGINHPIYNQDERAGIVSSLKYVDYVIIFPPGCAAEYIRKIKPDVYVKSGNYNLDTINQEERKIIEDYGGEICLIKGLPNISTTNTLGKIKDIIKKKQEI